ncbi:DUF664 domain-containing protein [Nocardioides litoris]|uniref:mycothiol transferase n=1 Tax=Nocardioides litoris TaxID=1926648 RepID=UPI001B87E0FB|nr:DUF664 domain-containing protein [Nocardioides litoris]
MSPEQAEPPYAADEVTMLRAWLDHQRSTFRRKTRGLTRDQMTTTHPPSTSTLAGLVHHLTYVEDWWFSVVLHGRESRSPFDAVDWDATPDWELDTAVDHEPEHLHGFFDDVVAASDADLDQALTGGGLDTRAARTRRGEAPTLRWVLLHLIEEYARHNGHADLIREAVDGSTGT